LELVDNGEPNKIDGWLLVHVSPEAEISCYPPSHPAEPGLAHQRGNLVIHDATP
jgi:hypothetical protein